MRFKIRTNKKNKRYWIAGLSLVISFCLLMIAHYAATGNFDLRSWATDSSCFVKGNCVGNPPSNPTSSPSKPGCLTKDNCPQGSSCKGSVDCNSGQECKNSVCVSCNNDGQSKNCNKCGSHADCPYGYFCTTQGKANTGLTCKPCVKDKNGNSLPECNRCQNDNDCPSGQKCISGSKDGKITFVCIEKTKEPPKPECAESGETCNTKSKCCYGLVCGEDNICCNKAKGQCPT